MNKNTLSIIAISSIALMLASCSSIRQSTAFSERKYYNFPHHNPVVVFDNKKNVTHNNVAAIDTKQQKQVIVNEQTGLQVVNATQPAVVSSRHKTSVKSVSKVTSVTKIEIPVEQETISSYAPDNVTAISSEHGGGNASGLSTVVLVIIAIFIAPLAVYLYDNAATTRFIIILILWLLAFVAFGGFGYFGIAWLVATIWAILIVTGSV